MVNFWPMDKIDLDVKAKVWTLAREKLRLQRFDIKKQLADLGSSREGEAKSSAGDKYETQREMIKQSSDILDVQLSRLQLMDGQLDRIRLQAFEHVQEGALVKLSIGLVWISVSLGKIVCQEKEYQMISKDSPLFLAIQGLKAGESTVFRGKKIIIEEVV